MRLSVRAIGRIRACPERSLIDDYRARADAAGRRLGFSAVEEQEIEPRRSGSAAETDALLAGLTPDTLVIALDERGRALSSEAFAAQLAAWRDQGRKSAVFLVGGADGLTEPARSRAELVLAFGAWTWPHRLARAMVFEQLYRAIAILGGAPYHRA